MPRREGDEHGLFGELMQEAATISNPDAAPAFGEGQRPPGMLGEDFEAEIRIEQSVHLVGQLPTLVVGNWIAVLTGFLLTIEYNSWARLSYWLWILALTLPMAHNWHKLRSKPRPAQVSPRRIRVAAAYSLLLGFSWLATMPIFLPAMPMINQVSFLFGIIIVCTGAVASISALPHSALAYLVPMMSGVVLVSLFFGTMPYRPVAVVSGLLFVLLPGFLRQNWNTFRRNVAIAVELARVAEMQRQEVARRAAAEEELRTAKDAAERAAEEVRRAQKRLQSIIEALPLPVVVFRLSDARTVYANRWAAQLLHLDLQNLLARSSDDFFAEPGEKTLILETLRQGSTVVDRETILKRADGSHLPVKLSSILMEFEGEKAIMGVAEDITLRKQNEEQLELARRRAEEANLAKSRFLANMSHELRTPLNAVLGYTELMADGIYGELPPKAASVLARIQTNGQHLLGLINDVLDLSKMEAGQAELHLEPYEWGNIIHSVVSATESLAQSKSLELRTEIDPRLKTGVGDERRLTQVLLNLVGNALKFTDEGHVAIRAAASEDMFDVTITDTGPGIAEQDQARIFSEFQQVDDANTRKKGGTGLGLAISRRLVAMHGGTLSVRSELGKGAVFTIRVPFEATRQQEDVE